MADQPANFGNTQITTTITPGSAIVNPVQDDSGKYIAKAVDAGAQGIGTIGGDIFQRYAAGNSAKIMNAYRQSVLQIADAQAQGSLSMQAAGTRLRTLYAQTTAANPYRADDIDKLNSSLLGDTGLGHVIIAGTPQQQADQAVVKAATGAGYVKPDGTADTNTYLTVQHQASATAAVLQGLQVQKDKLGYATELMKAQAHQAIVALGTVAPSWLYMQLDNFKANIAKTTDPAQRGQLIDQLNQSTNSQFAQWGSAGNGLESTDFIVKPLQQAVQFAIDAANGKSTQDVATAQIASVEAVAKLALLQNADMAKLVAASGLLATAGGPILDQVGSQIAAQIFATNSQPYDATPGANNPSPADILNRTVDTQNSLKILDSSLKNGINSPDPKIQSEVNNQFTNLLRGIAKGSKDPTDFTNVINFYASPNVAAWIKNGKTITPPDVKAAALDTLTNNYQNVVIPAVINRWDEEKDVVFGGKAGNQVAINAIADPVWDGSSLSFKVKPQYAQNSSIIGLVSQLNTGDRSLAVPINNLIRATAHIGGDTDYTKVWERLQPQLFTTATSTDTKADIKKFEPPAPAPIISNSSIDSFYEKIKGSANYAATHQDVMNPTGVNVLTHPEEYAKANIVSIPNLGTNGSTVQVNKLAAPYFEGFLRDLKATGYDLKSVEGYNPRSKMPSGNASEHAYGNAIDINPFAEGNDFSDTLKTNLPANISQLAAKWGLTWGGDWQHKKDAMHFEWTGINPSTQTASK